MSSAQRICYTRNGTQITDTAYQPCNSDRTRDASCCGTNHSGAGHTGVANDVCDANGLCQNFEAFDGTNEGEKLWWRQGCTDPTWESAECLKDVCNFARWQDENAPVRKCGQGTWCCGDKNCCGISSSVFTLAATVGVALPSSASIPVASSATRTASISPDVSASPTASTPKNAASSPAAAPSGSSETASNGLGTGAKAGIGAGIAVVAILLAIIAYLVMKMRKRKQVEGKDQIMKPQELEAEKHQNTMQTYHHPGPVEMYAGNAPVEIGGSYPTELPANKAHRV